MHKNRLSVLNYHQVPERADPLRPHSCCRSIFRAQLKMLGRFFNVVSMADGIRALRAGNLARNSVVITFDDGYRDNYEVAFDELKRASMPATFFIATDYLNGGRMWNDTLIESIRCTPKSQLDLQEFDLDTITLQSNRDKIDAIGKVIKCFKYMSNETRKDNVVRFAKISEAELPDDLMMTSDQVIELYDGGMTIGGHTASHPILTSLTMEEAAQDIEKGRSYLEQLLGEKPDYFAYPNGKPDQDYDARHVAMLKQQNFIAAFSTEWGYVGAQMNPHQLPRVGFADFTGWRFALRLQRSFFEAPVKFA